MTIHAEDVFSTSIPIVVIFIGESSLPSSFRMVELAILALMTTFQVVGLEPSHQLSELLKRDLRQVQDGLS